jgi:Abortive infection alpha
VAEPESRRADAHRGAGARGENNADAGLGPRELIEFGPALARLGLFASLRAAGWATASTAAAWKRIACAVRDRESPVDLAVAVREEAVAAARDALGVNDIEETLGRMTSEPPETFDDDEPQRADLRERARELLVRSASLGPEDDRHPAFGLVLEQLAPDELRILRVLAASPGQAALDVEARGPLGMGSRDVARRLSLLGDRAGCRHPERVQLYLDNLLRLGLVQMGDEPFEDEELYEVLEAQPEVNEAKEKASSGATRAKSRRHRIELSSFGRAFCETCLPTAESD